MSTEISYPENSRYMGRDITLATVPIGAITNTDVLKNLAAPLFVVLNSTPLVECAIKAKLC